jgi:hypothetical protein
MTPKLSYRTAFSPVLSLTVAALLAVGSPALARPIDLRSPDARDAGVAAAVTYQGDLRSPDARDAGRDETRPVLAPPTWPENPVVITDAQPGVAVAESSDAGFEWTDAAVGSAATLGLLLVLAGGVALVSRRHRAAPGGIAAS